MLLVLISISVYVARIHRKVEKLCANLGAVNVPLQTLKSEESPPLGPRVRYAPNVESDSSVTQTVQNGGGRLQLESTTLNMEQLQTFASRNNRAHCNEKSRENPTEPRVQNVTNTARAPMPPVSHDETRDHSGLPVDEEDYVAILGGEGDTVTGEDTRRKGAGIIPMQIRVEKPQIEDEHTYDECYLVEETKVDAEMVYEEAIDASPKPKKLPKAPDIFTNPKDMSEENEYVEFTNEGKQEESSQGDYLECVHQSDPITDVYTTIQKLPNKCQSNENKGKVPEAAYSSAETKPRPSPSPRPRRHAKGHETGTKIRDASPNPSDLVFENKKALALPSDSPTPTKAPERNLPHDSRVLPEAMYVNEDSTAEAREALASCGATGEIYQNQAIIDGVNEEQLYENFKGEVGDEKIQPADQLYESLYEYPT